MNQYEQLVKWREDLKRQRHELTEKERCKSIKFGIYGLSFGEVLVGRVLDANDKEDTNERNHIH